MLIYLSFFVFFILSFIHSLFLPRSLCSNWMCKIHVYYSFIFWLYYSFLYFRTTIWIEPAVLLPTSLVVLVYYNFFTIQHICSTLWAPFYFSLFFLCQWLELEPQVLCPISLMDRTISNIGCKYVLIVYETCLWYWGFLFLGDWVYAPLIKIPSRLTNWRYPTIYVAQCYTTLSYCQ